MDHADSSYLEVAGVAQDKTDAVAWLVGNDKVSPKNKMKTIIPGTWARTATMSTRFNKSSARQKTLSTRGNLPLAETMYRQALELSPSNSRILYLLGKVLNAMDSLEQALELMNQALFTAAKMPSSTRSWGRSIAK